MVAAAGESRLLAALAADRVRHDQMLGRTGTDNAALSEITAARENLLGQPVPDTATLSLLDAEHERLNRRNRALPRELPVVWARLGDIQTAVDLARSIPYPTQRAGALAEVATVVAATAPTTARSLAQAAATIAEEAGPDSIPDADMLAVTRALARTGLWEPAHAMAANQDYPEDQALMLAELAAVAAADRPQSARRLARKAIDTVRLIDRSGYKPGIGGEHAKQARTLADIAAALASYLPRHAARAAADAAAAARDIPTLNIRAEALAHVAATLAADFPDLATDLRAESEQGLRRLSRASGRTGTDAGLYMAKLRERSVRRAVAEALAAAGLIERAERIASKLGDDDDRDDVLVAIAAASAATGDWERAVDASRRTSTQYAQSNALTNIAGLMASVDPQQAARLARDAANAARAASEE
jgi:hypothetical protein